MTTRTWNGSSGNFTDAGSWSPTGIPQPGDVAVISAGSVALASTASNIAFQVSEVAGSGAATTLALNAATLDAASSLTINNQNQFNSTPPAISVSGRSVILGTTSIYGSRLQIAIASGSTLVNSGTMDYYSSSPQIIGGGAFENDGTVALLNPASSTQIPLLSDAVTGTGLFALGTHGRIDFAGAVSAGQTVLFNDGAAGGETLQIDQVGNFNATLNGFSSSDLIAVTNTPYTNATYTSTGANSGTLSLFNGATLEGSLNFTGQYALSSFSLNYNNFGNGQSNLQISTTVVNSQTGGLPPGYQSGGNGGLPVYRFFDTVFGTHLFTQSLAEAQTILATRPDLTQETNNFGAVLSADPNSEPVYRFFEQSNGTHFFTASFNEYLGLTTPGTATYRADFTSEPSSTFYEDATQQPSDVPVYRLFDTVHGTQFLTGSSAEYAGLTTAGSSTYRSDLTPEGVAFYAPTGTFHT